MRQVKIANLLFNLMAFSIAAVNYQEGTISDDLKMFLIALLAATTFLSMLTMIDHEVER